jgi:hypothetical protein
MEFIDCFNRRIELSDVRWIHIIETHPEIKEFIKELEGVLIEPELIKRSVYNENVVLFYKHYKHIYLGKYMCVIVRLDEKSIITAYITDRIKSGDVIWKKN